MGGVGGDGERDMSAAGLEIMEKGDSGATDRQHFVIIWTLL